MSGTGWIANHLGVFSGRSLREELFADKALAHVLTDDKEHFADLVGAGGARLSPGLLVSSYVDHTMSHEGIVLSPACLG